MNFSAETGKIVLEIKKISNEFRHKNIKLSERDLNVINNFLRNVGALRKDTRSELNKTVDETISYIQK